MNTKNRIIDVTPSHFPSADTTITALAKVDDSKHHRPLEPEDVIIPDKLVDLEDAVVKTDYDWRRAVARRSILLAAARHTHFRDDNPGWQAWCKKQFGYHERDNIRYLKIGEFIAWVLFPSLAMRDIELQKTSGTFVPLRLEAGKGECATIDASTAEKVLKTQDIHKLDVLAHVPICDLAVLVSKIDPATASRGDLRKAANEMKMSPKERELSNKLDAKRAENKKLEKDPATRINALAEGVIKEYGGCQDALAELDIRKALYASETLFNAAVNCYEKHRNRLTDIDALKAISVLEQMTTILKNMVEKAK
jgi:hypothetical protein